MKNPADTMLAIGGSDIDDEPILVIGYCRRGEELEAELWMNANADDFNEMVRKGRDLLDGLVERTLGGGS